jgi:hypothetical protein
MSPVSIESTTLVSERAKTVHALERPATVIGNWKKHFADNDFHNPSLDRKYCVAAIILREYAVA